MVLLFSAMGILLWAGFLLAAWLFLGTLLVIGKSIGWSVDLVALLIRRNKMRAASKGSVRPAPPRQVAPERNAPPARKPPAQKPTAQELTQDIMPKWNTAHRRDVDRDLAEWQAQFDALDRRNV
ncbi:hypothetical protein ACIQC0_01995 [Pseudarthrobacter sp. NPDC092419]|uniref:hypothetical protein n=1 Tax=Pseudarthrobacter sp. NPDC092419 TaxID=3364414 RepID=UPI00382AABC6